jgi:hypothetical protein
VRSYHFLQRTSPDEARDRKGVGCFYEDEDGEGSDVPPPAVTYGHEHGQGSGYGHDHGQFMGQRIEDPRNTVRKLEARVGESRMILFIHEV